MPMYDLFKSDRQYDKWGDNGKHKQGGFAARFVTQLMVAGLIFVLILVCYQKDNFAGEAVRYVVAMATADQGEFLAVNNLLDEDADENNLLPEEKEPIDNIEDNSSGTNESAWDNSAAYTAALGSNGKPELLLPASGVLMKSFGEVTSAGATCKGLIISCETAQQVKASAAGTITELTGEAGDYLLRVQHNGNTVTIYDGLHVTSVKKGDDVRQGDALGEMIAGKDLHFAVLADGKAVDPLSYLESPTTN